MSLKQQIYFVCQSCGNVSGKWSGKCGACGSWNSIIEEVAAPGTSGKKARSGGAGKFAIERISLQDEQSDVARLVTGIHEFDRACGGGLVPGSVLLVGGDPGIGKSTLVLQIAAALTRKGRRSLYISGEEAPAQIQLHAKRLGALDANIPLIADTHINHILKSMEKDGLPEIIIIDSIQTMWSALHESSPGTVTQVRSVVQEVVQFAKKRNVTALMVGHVTKDGQIAGPRVVEHMVDAVLYFEGERTHQFRILRAVKNRFGPTDEIGVFEMTAGGLREVENPSSLFLSERDGSIVGNCVFAGIEGSRPMLMEIQALCAATPFGMPRRTVVGWDSGRLAMILAVLEARCNFSLSGMDVYLNVAGGLEISEPAADLAVAAALVSSAMNKPLPKACMAFGEVGLSGGVRPVGQRDARLKEGHRLGFNQALLPAVRSSQKDTPPTMAPPAQSAKKDATTPQCITIHHLNDLLTFMGTTTKTPVLPVQTPRKKSPTP